LAQLAVVPFLFFPLSLLFSLLLSVAYRNGGLGEFGVYDCNEIALMHLATVIAAFPIDYFILLNAPFYASRLHCDVFVKCHIASLQI
jgi:hypothetical protein